MPSDSSRARPALPCANGTVALSPSILAANFADLKSDLLRLERAGCRWVHLDVMDGHFVPNLTFGPPVVADLRRVSKKMFFDAHLMIDEPWKLAGEFARAGAQLITVHAEACPDLPKVIRQLRRLNVLVGVSIRPKTPLKVLDPVIDKVDLILIMTVEPGFGGQALIPATLNKVRRLELRRQRHGHTYRIQVDGGINPDTAALAVAAGADVLVAGSAIFGDGKVATNIRKLRSVIGGQGS